MPSISVPVAIVGASVVGAGASLIASGNQASAAKSAANAQVKAAETASNTERDIYNQNKQMLQPWSDQGLQTYTTLNDLLGAGGSGNPSQMQDTLNNLPGYQFTLNQGLKSTQNSAAARGLADSGAALKGAAAYSTGLASGSYGNYVNQLQNSANTGESAANALAGYGTTTGTAIASNQIGAGNAIAAGTVGAANATAGGLNGVVNAGNNLSQYYMLNNLLKSTNTASNPDPWNPTDQWAEAAY